MAAASTSTLFGPRRALFGVAHKTRTQDGLAFVIVATTLSHSSIQLSCCVCVFCLSRFLVVCVGENHTAASVCVENRLSPRNHDSCRSQRLPEPHQEEDETTGKGWQETKNRRSIFTTTTSLGCGLSRSSRVLDRTTVRRSCRGGTGPEKDGIGTSSLPTKRQGRLLQPSPGEQQPEQEWFFYWQQQQQLGTTKCLFATIHGGHCLE